MTESITKAELKQVVDRLLNSPKSWFHSDVSLREILRRKHTNRKAEYMSNLQIACLIISERLNVSIDSLYAYHHGGFLYVTVTNVMRTKEDMTM